MARLLTRTDAHVIVNAIVKEATGGNSTLQVVDTSTFVSAGELLNKVGKEKTLNAISIVMGRTIFEVRKYPAKLQLITAMSSGLFTNRFRKIKFYDRKALPTGAFNTDLNGNNLKEGSTNVSGDGATASMYEQHPDKPVEINFYGSDVWQTARTVYAVQLQTAFNSEDDFIAFWEAGMVAYMNDVASQLEALNRMVVLNRIAGNIDMVDKVPSGVVNLTTEYNKKFGTQYTSEQLRTTYLDKLLAFFVTEFKLASNYMTNRSSLYHWTPSETETLTTFVPKSEQKALLYSPLFTEAEASVFPQIFNPQYLKIENYEGVEYWQNIINPAAIDVTPAIPNVDDPAGEQVAGANVKCPYVVGMLFDTNAIMTDMHLQRSDTSPFEARKKYYTIWEDYAKNLINDYTNDCIVFIMDDSGLPAQATAKTKKA